MTYNTLHTSLLSIKENISFDSSVLEVIHESMDIVITITRLQRTKFIVELAVVVLIFFIKNMFLIINVFITDDSI